MTVLVTSPVTGSAQTGLTSPTYTLVSSQPPNAYSKSYTVTALGGTQVGVDVSSASSPFTLTFSQPQTLRSGPVPNAAGFVGNAPRNVYSAIVRKGMKPLSGQNPQVAVFKCDFSVVAGADLVEPEDIRAALSLLIGALNQVSAGLGDTLVQGVL